jgi:hypothetical protein
MKNKICEKLFITFFLIKWKTKKCHSWNEIFDSDQYKTNIKINVKCLIVDAVHMYSDKYRTKINKNECELPLFIYRLCLPKMPIMH